MNRAAKMKIREERRIKEESRLLAGLNIDPDEEI